MSHTIKVIAVGCALLALCLFIGRAAGGTNATAGLVFGATVFLPPRMKSANLSWLRCCEALTKDRKS